MRSYVNVGYNKNDCYGDDIKLPLDEVKCRIVLYNNCIEWCGGGV
jgi:hypothetical protein